MSGGKGGKSSSSSYSTGTSTTQLPDWLNNASQQAVSTAQSLASQPYTPYLGQLVAGTPTDTLQAYQDVRNMQGMGMGNYAQDISALTGMTGAISPITTGQVQGNTADLYGGYLSGVAAPQAGLLGNYLAGAAPATAQQVGANAMTLMQPYEQAVLDPTLQLGSQALAQDLQKVGAAANQAGAFGGARQGVMEGVAQSQAAMNLAQYAGNLLATGYNASLTPAYNLAQQQSAQGMSAANALAASLQSGYGAAQTAGQGIANTNLAQGLQAAQLMPTALQGQQSAAQQQASLLQTIGAAQQNQQQAELNAQYGQFLTAQEYPYQSLDTLLSAVSGVPYGETTSWSEYGTQNQNQQRNIGSSILGGASSGASIGSTLGSFIPGLGNAAGGAAGAAVGGILGAL